jgi:drug/metabolite transporter (DMT)-like permease
MKTSTLIGLIFTPMLIAVGQVLFKLASREVGEFSASGLLGLARNPYLLAALVIYGAGTVLWVFLLKHVPLNIAYPFMALSFCLVPALGYFWLGEPLSWRYAGGVALILAGLLVARG